MLHRPKHLNIEVDKYCEIKEDVHVYEDYSVNLIQQDVEYKKVGIQDRLIKMQLLERNDGKKWIVWLANGMAS